MPWLNQDIGSLEVSVQGLYEEEYHLDRDLKWAREDGLIQPLDGRRFSLPISRRQRVDNVYFELSRMKKNVEDLVAFCSRRLGAFNHRLIVRISSSSSSSSSSSPSSSLPSPSLSSQSSSEASFTSTKMEATSHSSSLSSSVSPSSYSSFFSPSSSPSSEAQFKSTKRDVAAQNDERTSKRCKMG